MSAFVNTLKKSDLFFSKPGVSDNQISGAQSTLGLEFAKEYKDYLREYAVVSVNGHEITGILPGTRFDVVEVTEEERGCSPDIPTGLYVVEQTNIDGIVIWQDDAGDVYQTTYGSKPEPIYASLDEYIKS